MAILKLDHLLFLIILLFIISLFLFYKILSNPNRYKADNRKSLPYNKVPSFWGALTLAAKEHEYQGFLARTRYISIRFLNYLLHLIARILPYTKLRVPLHRMRGVKIGQRVQLGPHVFIDEAFPEYVYIGNNVAIAPGVWLISHSKVPYAFRNELDSFVEPLVIEDDVWLAARVTVLPGVTIGKGSIITAGSLVTSNVPPGTMFGGVPARPIKKLN